MRKQKKMTLLLLLCFGVVSMYSQSLNVAEKNGTISAFTFSDIRNIAFSGENLVLNRKNGNTLSYSISNIRNLFFSSIINSINTSKGFTDNLKLYPNPVQQELYISYLCDNNEHVQIDVFGIDGKVIYSSTVNGQSVSPHIINVSGWLNGIYFVRMTTKMEIITNKFIKN